MAGEREALRDWHRLFGLLRAWIAMHAKYEFNHWRTHA
jgi:hypothetical protein